MKRLRSVTIIGSLLLMQSLLFIFVFGVAVVLVYAEQFGRLPPELAAQVEALGLALPDVLVISSVFVIGVFGLVSSIGLLRMRRWGWLMTMLVQGISMVMLLVDYFQGQPNYAWMLFTVFVVLYLNQRDIQHAFEVDIQPMTPRESLREARPPVSEELPQEIVSHE